MNYRHAYHAGNFADVLKHALLVRLMRALQRKEKGFLYVDTHAGRGGYDLSEAAAGALEYLPIVRVTNINRSLEELKEKGYWIYGLDERGTEAYDQVEYASPTAMVLGGEGKGCADRDKQQHRPGQQRRRDLPGGCA